MLRKVFPKIRQKKAQIKLKIIKFCFSKDSSIINASKNSPNLEKATNTISLKSVKNTKVPTKPEYPDPDECCGSGCRFCVYELYEMDLERWEKYFRDKGEEIPK